MESIKLAQKKWEYTLYRMEDGRVILSVLCGGAAMYELNIPLDDETAAKAIDNENFLEDYAKDIRNRPDQYASRSVSI